MKVTRLESIDIWKGITILSVLHIHTVFKSGRLYLPDWTRSLALLIDIPVFFFISGYLLHNLKTKVIVGRMLRQFRRLVSDYLLVSIAALLLALAAYAVFRFEIKIEVQSAVVSGLNLKPVNSLWEVFPAYGSSMWYLRVYISILPLGVLILASPLKKRLVLLPFLFYVFFILTTLCPPLDQRFLFTDTRSAVFYLTIFLAGALFKDTRKRLSFSILSISWLFLIVATFFIVLLEGGMPNLQDAKFPPSSLYFLFSSHSILAFCLVMLYEIRNKFPNSMERVRSLITWCGQHSYRIFLWQGVATSVPIYFVPVMLEIGFQTVVIFAVSLLWNVTASLGLTFMHNRILPASNQPN